MSTGDDFPSHKYTARCRRSGSTIGGYEGYDRKHSAFASPATLQLDLSSDGAFRGDPNLVNPEQLVVLAAASCQLLSFLAVAARARINVLAYEDEAIGVMPEGVAPMRMTSISLRPTIRVAADLRQIESGNSPRSGAWASRSLQLGTSPMLSSRRS